MKITAILLAAGLSRRAKKDKLLLEYHGRLLLQRSIDLLSELNVYQRIIITGEARLAHIILPDNLEAVINQQPEKGQSESIKIGIKVAQTRQAAQTTPETPTHYLFLTADQPMLTVNDIKPLLEAALVNPSKIICPIIDSEPNSPVIFPVKFQKELLSLSGDTGGRVIRDANKEHCMGIEPDKPENFRDIDSMEDYYDIV